MFSVVPLKVVYSGSWFVCSESSHIQNSLALSWCVGIHSEFSVSIWATLHCMRIIERWTWELAIKLYKSWSLKRRVVFIFTHYQWKIIEWLLWTSNCLYDEFSRRILLSRQGYHRSQAFSSSFISLVSFDHRGRVNYRIAWTWWAHDFKEEI